MFCRKCGAENPDDSVFCQACGERFQIASVPAQAEADAPPPYIELLKEQLKDRYEILHKLGAGGMAEVYLGRELALDRQVAIKVLPQVYHSDVEAVARFTREAQITARLEHPNIVRIYAVCQEPDMIFYVMNLITGGSLTDRIRQHGAQGIQDIVRWGQEVCAGLECVHQQGVIVRDLKPDNILLNEDERAILADFGIARQRQEAHLTQVGTAIGTPQYMSPEQAQGGDLDARSDIYSMGIVLYQLATGRLPFSGKDPASLIYKQVHEKPEPPQKYNKKVPEWLQDIILQCLAKEPDKRYRSAAALGQILGQRKEQAAASEGALPTQMVSIVTPDSTDSMPQPVAETPTTPPASEAAELAVNLAVSDDISKPAKVNEKGLLTCFVEVDKRRTFSALFILGHAIAGGLLAALLLYIWPFYIDHLAPSLGLLGLLPSQYREIAVGHLMAVGVFVPLLALLQWLLLRIYARINWYWLLATIGGGAFSLAVALVLLDFAQYQLFHTYALEIKWGMMALGAVLIVATPLVCQWLALRARAQGTAGWLLGSGMGLLLGTMAVILLNYFSDPINQAIGTELNLVMRLVLGGAIWGGAQVAYLWHFQPTRQVSEFPLGIAASVGTVLLGLVWVTGVWGLMLGAHTDPVRLLGFSPDNSLVASSGNQLKLWEITSGRKHQTFPTDRVEAMAFSNDGKYILTRSGMDIQVWNIASGTRLESELDLRAAGFGIEGRYRLQRDEATNHWGWRDSQTDGWIPLEISGLTGEAADPLQAPSSISDTVTVALDSTSLSVATEVNSMTSQPTANAPVATVDWIAPFNENIPAFIEQASAVAVTALVFDPEGWYILSGDEDGGVSLWDNAAEDRIRSFYDLTLLVLAGVAVVVLSVFEIAFIMRHRGNKALDPPKGTD
jgi:serine/threonine protein kinase/WD40 repeat protein